MGERCPVPRVQRAEGAQHEKGIDRGRGSFRDTPGTTTPEEDRFFPVRAQTVDRGEGQEGGEGVTATVICSTSEGASIFIDLFGCIMIIDFVSC